MCQCLKSCNKHSYHLKIALCTCEPTFHQMFPRKTYLRVKGLRTELYGDVTFGEEPICYESCGLILLAI